MKRALKFDPAQYDADNRLAAKVIAADPAKYGGLMQTWAALVIAKAEAERFPLLQGQAA